MSEYAFALDDTHYIFRLRTGKGEAESVRFYYAEEEGKVYDVADDSEWKAVGEKIWINIR